MIVMAVTVQILSVVMAPVMVAKLKKAVQKTALQATPAETVNLIGLPTDLNAVIPHGMNMVLIA
jgi:hypothetical protein